MALHTLSIGLWKKLLILPWNDGLFPPMPSTLPHCNTHGRITHGPQNKPPQKKTLLSQLSSKLPLDLIQNKGRKGAGYIQGILWVSSSTLDRESGLFQFGSLCVFRYFKLALFTHYTYFMSCYILIETVAQCLWMLSDWTGGSYSTVFP